MQLIQCNSQAWADITAAITRKQLSAGVRVIQGSSQQVTKEIQALLSCLSTCSVHYFLSSNDTYFSHPCYATLLDTGSAAVEHLNAFHVMDYAGLSARETRDVYTPQYAVQSLQEKIDREPAHFQLIILEYLTVPTKDELLFIKKIFWSSLVRKIPVFIFIHSWGESELEDTHYQDTHERELLAFLYMAGGRIEEAEWQRLPLCSSLYPAFYRNGLISTRAIGSHVWITYRDSRVAATARKVFHELSQADQQRCARALLAVLPLGIRYPLLAISCTTGDLAALLACYTSPSIKTALIQPDQVLAYFRMLRRSLKRQNDSTLLESATTNYMSALLCCYRTAPARVYQCVKENESYFIRTEVKARFLFTLGQILIQFNDNSSLQAATDCFQKSHMYLDALETIDQYERASRVASLYNGEALIALKLQRNEMALQLEERALHELQTVADVGFDSINIQQILFLTHIGDVYRRKLANSEMAIPFYEKAYGIALANASPGAKSYVMPRLADTLIQVNREQEAISVLENLWHALKAQQQTYSESNNMTTLKTGLVLAQIYMQQKMWRKAACYYWCLLKQSAWLKPAIVRGIVANLQYCRPDMHPRLRKYAMRAITLQENSLHDSARIERCFKTILDSRMSPLMVSEPESM